MRVRYVRYTHNIHHTHNTIFDKKQMNFPQF